MIGSSFYNESTWISKNTIIINLRAPKTTFTQGPAKPSTVTACQAWRLDLWLEYGVLNVVVSTISTI